MKKYYFFIGTEAEFIKLFPVIKEFQNNNIDFKIISSGQNSIKNTELTDFLKKEPDIILSDGIKKKSALSLFIWFFKTLFSSIKNLHNEFKNQNRQETFLIVHGDTVSTLMGAILSKIYRLKLVHIEAGLRSFNLLKPFPEEIDRVLTSKFVDIAFCPNEWAVNNLKNSKAIKVNTMQNTLLDSLSIATNNGSHSEFTQKLNNTKYFVFVLHRQENLFNANLVKNLINKIIKVSENLKCVFILHATTKKALYDLNLLDDILNNKNIIITKRLSYFDMVSVLNGAEFVLTDGGSNQEECYYLGKPCCILRNETERIEGVGKNVVISKNDLSVIDNFIENYNRYKHDKITAINKPSKIIFDYLNNYGK